MGEPLTAVVYLHAREEYRDELRRGLIDLAALSRDEPGNLCYVLHDVPDDANQFVIYEQWRDQAALDEHMRQEYLTAFLDACPRLLSREITETECREIKA